METEGAGSTIQSGANGHGSNSATAQEVSQYCEKYLENFSFYCAGQSSPEYEKFCRSFRQNCPQKVGSLKESGSFLGGEEKSEDEGAPTSSDTLYLYKGTRADYCNKFSVHYEFYCKGSSTNTEITTKFCPFYKKSCKEHLERSSCFSSSARRSSGICCNLQLQEERGDRRKRELSRRPCTADCDQRIFPHCTQSCKCDYAYPSVQKFCNPPPLPLFLNTCRLWYAGCPKYERYHYASQFIYSKAEKGKRILLPSTQRLFNVLSPTGERIPVAVQQPGSKNIARKDRGNGYRKKLRNCQNISECNVPSPVLLEEYRIANTICRDIEQLTKRVLFQLSSICNRSQALSYETGVAVKGIRDIPVVPSDSVFANALQQYGSFTDSQGILHRPHSTSPFTKPGLWEPNPNNPHNRDHSNKFYYRPESFNADWLNGQLAWGAHFAVPAVGVGGTDGFSALYFPNAGSFLNIPDDYD
ncbi:hypothetical protein Angca_005078 [Angiostrongylus cantonensis]|nr:hypothetical protein Angca_005078 [Angiostrongylus cantonensis]